MNEVVRANSKLLSLNVSNFSYRVVMSHRSRQKEHGEVVEPSPERSPEIEIAAQEDWGFSGDDEQHNDQAYERFVK